jgi:hypothetical protein
VYERRERGISIFTARFGNFEFGKERCSPAVSFGYGNWNILCSRIQDIQLKTILLPSFGLHPFDRLNV